MTTKTTTGDQAIAAAHAAAADAEQAAEGAAQEKADAHVFVADLEKAVLAGDDSIGPGEIPDARRVAEHAALRAKAAATKATQAREAHRQAQLQELAGRLRNHEGDPTAFDAALTDLEAALETIATLADQRREDIAGYRHEMQALGVPATAANYAQRRSGAPEDLGMGYAVGGGVGIDKRVLRPVDLAPIVKAVVYRASARHRESLNLMGVEIYDLAGHDLHESLRSQAFTPPPAPADPTTRCFRHRDSGAIVGLGPEAFAPRAIPGQSAEQQQLDAAEKSPMQAQIDKGELIEISREEAGQ